MLTTGRLVASFAWDAHDPRSAAREAFYAALQRIPGADPAYERRRHPEARAVCGGVDLVIEGFPGSANSWAVHLVRLANPGIRTADHRHRAAQVLEARRRNIPTLLLIRQPIDALASIITRRGLHPRVMLLYYRNFYEACEPALDYVVVATFEQIVDEPDGVIERINARYDKRLLGPSVLGPDARARIIADVAGPTGQGHAVPDQRRTAANQRSRAVLSRPGYSRDLAACQAIYGRVATHAFR